MSQDTKNRIESMKRLIKHADTMLVLLQEMKASIHDKNLSLTEKINHVKQLNNVRYDVI